MKDLLPGPSVALLLTALLFSSCKEEGPIGPAGPAGNANVKAVTFNILASDWQYHPSSAHLDKPLPEITQQIWDKGAVVVYWQINNAWVALPFTYPAADSVTQFMGYDYTPGNLRIFVTRANGTAPDSLNTATFKAVITAGS
jgi:hypothetical protein